MRLVEFVKKVLAQRRVRVIGVCYGHQIVGRALGAKVARSEGGAWEVSVCEVVQTERGRELFGGKDTLVGGSHSLAHYLDDQEVRNQYGKLMRRPWQSIFQMHKDLVYNYPHGVEELGSSGPCKVQGMYIPKRVITVQGHPEFTEEIVKELLEKRREQNIFGDEIYQEAMARVARPHDGVLVAKAFLRFLMEE